MKICAYCGKEMDDSVQFCANCGTNMEAAQIPEEPVLIPEIQPPKKKINKKKLILSIVIPAVAVILAAVICCVVLLKDATAHPWSGAMENYIGVYYESNQNKLTKLAPTEYWDYMEYKTGKDKQDIKNRADDWFEDQEDRMTDRYGDDCTATYTVKWEKPLSSRMIDGIRDSLYDQYRITRSSVKKGYSVELDLVAEGDEDFCREGYYGRGLTYTFVQIGLQWYLINLTSEFDNGRYYYTATLPVDGIVQDIT